ncbi:hypothetical protein [Listeria rustica]|uniref:Uncharacterized protein n=1 Tax=Listeria rustica TaxID=2713503 RepID=A0A7W1T6K4_9LIST|nr:hypothetical protein [Listeria rustica]MBA3926413.1 hypothetical protein [Listeria rustica]
MNKKTTLKRVGVALVATAFLGGVYVTSSPGEAQASTTLASTNSILQVNPLFTGVKTITGTGVPGHYINITNLSTKAVLTTGDDLKVSANGTFSFTLPSALTANQVFTISDSLDLKGTVANYTVQGSGFNVNPLVSGATTITGTGIPGHYLNIDNLSTHVVLATGNTVRIAADGTFSFTLPAGSALKTGQQISIADSQNLRGTTIFTVQSGDLSVNPISAGDVRITGTGIPGHYLNIGNLSTQTVLATGNALRIAADGTFSFIVPAGNALKAGQQISIADTQNLKGVTTYTVGK